MIMMIMMIMMIVIMMIMILIMIMIMMTMTTRWDPRRADGANQWLWSWTSTACSKNHCKTGADHDYNYCHDYNYYDHHDHNNRVSRMFTFLQNLFPQVQMKRRIGQGR